MVLESILYPERAEKLPWAMFLVGAVYSSVAIVLALWIFRSQASFAAVFFTVLAAIPIIYRLMKYEEAKDLKYDSERQLIKEHNRAIAVMGYFFLGVVFACVLFYIFLPQTTVNEVFSQQIATIANINNKATSKVTGFVTAPDLLFKIFLNNLKVMIFCILFAFLYGSGAVFILTWNATVIATAIGNTIRSGLAEAAMAVGAAKIAAYFGAISYGVARYAIHGVPEIISYFYAGIAGAIISVAIVKNHFSTEHANTIILDVSELILIALGFLVVGAILEVYVTPVLF